MLFQKDMEALKAANDKKDELSKKAELEEIEIQKGLERTDARIKRSAAYSYTISQRKLEEIKKKNLMCDTIAKEQSEKVH